MDRGERPEAIIITLSLNTIKDYRGGYRAILNDWINSDGESMLWYYKCGNAPVQPVSIVYWVVAGRIRWQCRLVSVLKNHTMKFSNGSFPMYAKAWLELIDFEQIPRQLQLAMPGFQGFRYSAILF